MPVKLCLVAAACEGMGIGQNGALPWRLKKEMAFFKRLTTECSAGKQNAVIMGKNTWVSIPAKFRPLADRYNIVISSTLPTCNDVNFKVVRSFEEAVDTCNNINRLEHVYIIGGSRVYDDALNSSHISRIYLTQVHAKYECDTFFPDFDRNAFKLIQCPDVPTDVQEEDGVKFSYEIYEKMN